MLLYVTMRLYCRRDGSMASFCVFAACGKEWMVMDKIRLTMDNALDALLQGKISAREYAGFVLAPFLAQEERNCRGILETLKSYFACNGNTIRAAEMLLVHRNTVKYRLGQAEAILGCSLSYAGVRLKVQLALYIRSQEQDNGKKV